MKSNLSFVSISALTLHGASDWNQSINAVLIGTLTHLLSLRRFSFILRNLVVFVTTDELPMFFISSVLSLLDENGWICDAKLSLSLLS